MRALSCSHTVARDIKIDMMINGVFSMDPFIVCDGVLQDLICGETKKNYISKVLKQG